MLAIARSPRFPLAGVALALVVLPFELLEPWLRFPGLSLSNLEALVALAILAWVTHRLVSVSAPRQGQSRFVERIRASHPLLWPALAIAVIAFLSAILSPDLRPSALKMAGRLTGGVIFGLVVADVGREPKARQTLVNALVAGATLTAMLGLLEIVGVGWVTPFLQLFRLDQDQLGPAARLNASFDSANTTAMLLAPALCLAFGLVGRQVHRETGIQVHRETGRQGDRETGRQGAGETGRQGAGETGQGNQDATPHVSPPAPLADAVQAVAPAIVSPVDPTHQAPLSLPTSPPLLLLVSLYTCLLSSSLLLTYSRGGALAAVVGLGVMGVGGGRRAWWAWLPTIGLVGVALGVTILAFPVLRARLAIWDTRPLDGAVFVAPPTLTGPAGAMVQAQIQVTNTGRLTWRPDDTQAWGVGYHWLAGDGQRVLKWDTSPLALPHAVAPGESVAITAPVLLPAAGEYVLLWDLAQPGGRWLGAATALPTRTTVRSEGLGGLPLATPFRAEVPPPPPDRLTLWRAALAMTRDRPLLGVGTGGFRHVYGRYLGLNEWDARIFANNLYLEVLADMGIIGLVAWLWLFVGAGWYAWRACGRGDPGPPTILAALVAFLTHGLVDVALEITAIYLLWATLLGLAASLRSSPNL